MFPSHDQGGGATGTTYGDMNAYSLTFQGMEVEPAEEIATSDGTLADALTGYTVG